MKKWFHTDMMSRNPPVKKFIAMIMIIVSHVWNVFSETSRFTSISMTKPETQTSMMMDPAARNPAANRRYISLSLYKNSAGRKNDSAIPTPCSSGGPSNKSCSEAKLYRTEADTQMARWYLGFSMNDIAKKVMNIW